MQAAASLLAVAVADGLALPAVGLAHPPPLLRLFAGQKDSSYQVGGCLYNFAVVHLYVPFYVGLALSFAV